MRTSDIAATIILIVLAFITMVLAISFEQARVALWDNLRDSAESLGIYGKVDSFLISMELIFWMIFIISLVGVIVVYFIGSHEEEGETYAPSQEYMY